MAIQKLGIRATCDHCAEQGVAGNVKELGERLGWRVVTGKSQQTFCTMHCEQEWVNSQLSPTQTSLEDALHGAEQNEESSPMDFGDQEERCAACGGIGICIENCPETYPEAQDADAADQTRDLNWEDATRPDVSPEAVGRIGGSVEAGTR